MLRLAQRADDPALAVIAHLCPRVDVVYALARCLLPASTWRKASHATRQTSAVRQCSAWAKIRELPADPISLLTLWLLGYPSKPWPASTMPWRWHTSCRIPIVWRLRGVEAACVSQFCRDVPAVHEHAEAAVALSTEQGFPSLGGLWNELSWVGAGHAGSGRGGDGTGPPRDHRLAGHRGSAARPILMHRAGGSLCPSGPHGRRPPGAGRGPHPGGAA